MTSDRRQAKKAHSRNGRFRSMSDLLRGAPAHTLATNVTNMGLGVVTGILTARAMAPEGRGALVAVVIWTSTVATFAVLGLDEAVVYASSGDGSRAATLRRALRITVQRQTMIGSAIVVAANLVVLRGWDVWTVVAGVLMSLVVPLNAFNQMAMSQLRVEQHFGSWNLLRLIPAFVYALSVATLAALSGLTVMSGILGLLVGTAFTTMACAAVLRSRTPSPARVDTREVRAFGRRLVVANLPYLANQRLDQLMLGLLVAPAVLGIYAVAVSVAAIVQMVGVSLEQILFPRMASGAVGSDIVGKVVGLVTGTLVAASILLGYFATDLITLVYGADYASAARALQILLAGTVAAAVSLVLTAEAKARGDSMISCALRSVV